jgi:ATP-dependent Lhr-like helicase
VLFRSAKRKRVNDGASKADDAERVEQIALALLRRYGVVFMRMLEREASWLPKWRDLLRVYRKLEARGEIRGGRFVSGFSGEQFALPEAVASLRSIRRRAPDDSLVSVSGADPLNLAGILTPGPKLAALAGNRVLYRDAIPIAFLEADSTRLLEAVGPDIENLARAALHGHAEPSAHLPPLRRLAQLEAARALADRRARPAGRLLRASDSKTASH